MISRRFKDWVNTEVQKELDKEPFSSLPVKMRIGIILLLISFLAGYGIPVLLLIVSKRNHQLTSGVVNGTFVYTFFWVLGFVGLTLAGKDCIKYPIYFSAKLLKTVFPKSFRTNASEDE